MTRLSDSGASHRPIRVLVALSVLILSGMSVVATTALPALAGPAGTCPQGYRPNESAKQGDSPYWVLTWGASACKLASGTVSISSAGRPVFVSGKAALDDSERAVSRDARSYISAVVRCYNSAGSVVWSIGSITNMWTGATGVNLYPRGLFLLSANNLPTGTYTCDLEVSNQGKVTNVASPRAPPFPPLRPTRGAWFRSEARRNITRDGIRIMCQPTHGCLPDRRSNR